MVRLVVVTFRIEEPEAATGFGVKVTEDPEGDPATESATLPVKPPIALVVTVYDAAFVRSTVIEDGDAVSEKSGRGFTTSVMGTECAVVPLLPVTVKA